MSNSHFYYLRHGETDHNRHRISDDDHDIPLNDLGVIQANEVAKFMQSMSFPSFGVSPLKRARETLEIISSHREDESAVEIVEEFHECTFEVWKDMTNEENKEFSQLTEQFLMRVKNGLAKVLKMEKPLVVAHGGVFWGICHHLNLDVNRMINNCQLIEFFEVEKGQWRLTYHHGHTDE